ncbi:hypothetical protein [Microbispora sp. H10836]|uniref:hypothetical protein n=1 Tax=Microbispora sp. H10836 TaxID=2729106 RepID=UPI0014763BB6|nr:hypothetical protein [Microbispora sp. H10836]
MTLRLRLIVSISLAAGLTLSACSESEPTAAEAGQVLKSHIDQTVKNAVSTDVEVADPGGKDIACGNGKYKRTYAVQAKSVWSLDSQAIITGLIGALDYADTNYKLVSADTNPPRRVAVSDQYHTRIVLSSPARDRLMVSGETECLPLE